MSAASSITPELLERYQRSYQSDPRYLIATNAVCNNAVTDVILKRDVSTANKNQVFSTKMKYKESKITDQKSTGRCWLFAATNTLRLSMIETYKCDDFQFSQPYLFFWDKFEKANYFLECMIDLAHEDPDSRVVSWLSKSPVIDGGQYDMFLNIVEKYGLVPLDAFPESQHSANSKDMNWLLGFILRQSAQQLRELVLSGASKEDVREAKNKVLEEIYRILCIFFGTPPSKFDWRFKSSGGKKKKKKSGDEEDDEDGSSSSGITEFLNVTPLQFAREIVPKNVSKHVSIINDPRNEYGKMYTVDRLGNVVGGRPVAYLNLPIESLKLYAAKTISAGEPVWFGCDVRKFFHGKLHCMDTQQFDYEGAFGVTFSQSKADRLRYHQSLMTHAMVFTAFDGPPEQPTRWRVENSWGDKNNKGYGLMTDAWFNEFMYQIVVDEDLLSEEHQKCLHETPTVLPAWDPMGSLALCS
eukprot:TRINITY_DN11496_c0_g2_i1.p1 TRINITY_DN11496_c0_g2~~TRINITY_DN11496_c0_g2_i1.p1  ORF type:complete len:469 (+),score=132.69 TRINITY_DN11496_c0_g2_i1:170-1576(+)